MSEQTPFETERVMWCNSNHLDWSDYIKLEETWKEFCSVALSKGKRVGLSLFPEHYVVTQGKVWPKGSLLLITLAHKVRIIRPNGTTKTIKDILWR